MASSTTKTCPGSNLISCGLCRTATDSELHNRVLGLKMGEPGCLEPGFLESGCLEPGFLEPGCLEPGCLEPGFLEPGFLEPGFKSRSWKEKYNWHQEIIKVMCQGHVSWKIVYYNYGCFPFILPNNS